MDRVESAFQSACEALDVLAGPLATILMIALIFGLVCLCAGLTVLALWKSLNFGFRLAALQVWVKATEYLATYFNRLRRFGLTRIASRIAVACGFIVWGGIALAFAFQERLWDALGLTLLVLVFLYSWGWGQRGPRAQFFKFTRGFLEPTMAFAIPTFIAKSGDFLFKFVVSTINRHVAFRGADLRPWGSSKIG
jgi:hypothetical protein